MLPRRRVRRAGVERLARAAVPRHRGIERQRRRRTRTPAPEEEEEVWVPGGRRRPIIMLAWAVLILTASIAVKATSPIPPDNITTIGSQKLATASDCSKPVAFSGSHAELEDEQVILPETLLDQGVGYVASTGIFTTYCPGLYQFSFVGHGGQDLQLTLKRKLSKTDNWLPVTSTGLGGGSNIVLLRMAVGHQVALFADSGTPDDTTTFSGYRIAKE